MDPGRTVNGVREDGARPTVPACPAGRARFHGFELDLATADLRRAGVPVPLQPQAGAALALLVRWRAAAAGATRAVVLGSLLAQRGRYREALGHLEEAVRLRSPYSPFLATDSHLSGLSREPEFQALLARIGHPLAAKGGRTRTVPGPGSP